MQASVKDDSQEIGVLRAIGLTKDNVIRLMLMEGLSNLASSLILGIVVGLIAAAMTALMFTTMVELPFTLIVSNILSLCCLDPMGFNHWDDSYVHRHRGSRDAHWGPIHQRQVDFVDT